MGRIKQLTLLVTYSPQQNKLKQYTLVINYTLLTKASFKESLFQNIVFIQYVHIFFPSNAVHR